MTLTYVYCLVRSARRPSLRGAPAGMAGSREVRLLEAGDGLWVAVSSVPAKTYAEAALQKGLHQIEWVGERAMEHEAVVEHFLSAPAVLPMQLFALFTSDDRAVAHVTRDRRRLARILDRIERKVEWGLRLTWDERAARTQVEKSHARPASGRDYLSRKRDLLDVNRGQLAGARAEADRVYQAMSRQAVDARRRKAMEQAAPGSRLLLDAAFLVPVGKSAAFRAAVRARTRELARSGLAVSLTGPWPPYNFI